MNLSLQPVDWATLAIVSAALFGTVSIVDKFIIERQVQDVRTFILVIGTQAWILGLIILLNQPIGTGTPLGSVILAIAAGLTESGGLILMFYALRTDEVSRAVSVTQTFPIFVAILAVLFLNETLGLWEWMAIMVTVLGAVILSTRRTPEGSLLLSRSFLLLIVASVAMAVSRILTKEALTELSSWNMLGIFLISLTPGFLLVCCRRTTIREAYQILKRPITFSLFIGDSAIAMGALWVQFAAFAAGPVSLVSALVATRPFFIFMYTILLSQFMPRFLSEPLNLRILVVKFLAIAMIVGGSSRILMN